MKKGYRIWLAALTVAVALTVSLFAAACGESGTQPQTYTVSFVVNGEQIKEITEEAGKDITPPSVEDEKNGTFLDGWYLNERKEGESLPLPTVMPAENRTYYATYEAGVTLSYTYTVPEERVQSDVTGAAPVSVTVRRGSVITVSDGDLAVAGCRIAGWTAGEGEDARTYRAGDKITLETSVTLRAEWNVGFKGTGGESGNYAFCSSATFSFSYGGQPIVVRYQGGDALIDFELEGERYCVSIDETNKTYTVKLWGTEPNGYYLYLPRDGSVNYARYLTLFENGTATVLVEGMEGVGAEGTYRAVNGSDGEYTFTVTNDQAFGTIGDFRFKLGEPVEREGTLINVYMIYDDEFSGEYAAEGGSITLDSYGGAVYAAAGKQIAGTYYVDEIEGFEGNYLFLTASGTNERYTFRIDGRTCVKLGNEIGVYQIWNVEEEARGRQKLVFDGAGGITVLYGDYSYSVNKVAATGEYRMLDGGDFAVENFRVTVQDVLPANYKDGMRVLLYRHEYSDTVVVDYLIYDEAIAGVFQTEDGTGRLTLDGYGGKAVFERGDDLFTGAYVVDGNFVVVMFQNDARIYKIERGADGALGTVFEMGSEIGIYYLYHAVDGFHPETALRFDGAGTVTVYTYDPDTDSLEEGESGDYSAEGLNEWLVQLGGESFRVLLAEIDFGSDYEPDVYPVYVVYDESWAGTFRNGSNRLTLDGYGMRAVYVAGGVTYTGNFTVDRSVVVVLTEDGKRFVFKLDGNNFTPIDLTAGLHFKYVLDSDLAWDGEKLFLDGDGNAALKAGANETNGTYRLKTASGDEYEFTADNGDNFSFKLRVTQSGQTVFIVYDALWAGEFTRAEDGERITLDGYGGMIYTKTDGTEEELDCSVQGSEGRILVFTDESGSVHKLLLDRSAGKFSEAPQESGYNYLYTAGAISGYVRLFLDGDGHAEYARYNAEKAAYDIAVQGGYTASEAPEGAYVFTPAGESDANAFVFVLKEVDGYPVFALYDGEDCVYTNPNGETLVLDGFAQATFSFTEDGEEVSRAGFYTVEGDTVTVQVTYAGYVAYTYVFQIDRAQKTFLLISAE